MLNVWETEKDEKCEHCGRKAFYGVDTKAESALSDQKKILYFCEVHGRRVKKQYDRQEREAREASDA